MAKAGSQKPRSRASASPRGFDPGIANQVTLLTLTGALNQQQLNAAAARAQVGAAATTLTLGVQGTQLAGLKMIFGLSTMEAGMASMIQASMTPSHVAGLNAAAAVPMGG